MINFLNGIAWRRHHSHVRNNPWTMFFCGLTRTKKLSAAPFRPLPSVTRIDISRFYSHRRTLSEMVFLKLSFSACTKSHTEW